MKQSKYIQEENCFEVGDIVTFKPTGNVGEVMQIIEDFCKVKFEDKESFLEYKYLKLTNAVGAARFRKSYDSGKSCS